MEKLRRAQLRLIYEGTDISGDLAPFLISGAYTDFANGQADDFQFTLEDTDGLWSGGWYPQKGATVEASLKCTDWFSPDAAAVVLEFGTFEIDDISSNSPPSTVTIKAISALVATSMRREKHSKGWENITLSAIAREVAECHGLKYFFEADGDVRFERIDQRDESDMAFLARVCRENGFNCKVGDEKLIVYQAKRFDERPCVLSINKGEDWIQSYNFRSKSHDIYKGVRVRYWDALAAEEKVHTYTPPVVPPCGHELVVNRRAESLAQAQRMAKASLRRVNKDESKGMLNLVGHPGLLAGVNITVGGFGVFAGKYFAEKVRHSFPVYRTSADIRKVLDY